MKKFILVSHPQNRVTNVLLCCLILTSHIFCATASADQPTDDRNNALEALTHDKQSGLNQLHRLARGGDDRSYYLLGTLSLYGKFGVAQDLNKAEKLFIKSAENCYADAVVILTKFYMQRGSQFFDPLKGNALKKRCAAKIVDDARKAEELAAKKKAEELAAKKKAEELAAKKKAEELAAKKKAEELAAKRVADEEAKEKEKLAAQKTPIKKTEDDKSNAGITSGVLVAWQKILPIYEEIESSGSAVSITGRGHFLTNFHVIEKCDPHGIAIKYNGLVGQARVINYYSDLDVALLKVDAPTPFFAEFDTSKLRFGEKLFALGFPVEAIFGSGPSFSEGLLTNTKDAETVAKKEGFLLVSFPIASGNSGGPVFNQLGGLRGITSYGINPKALADFFKEEYDTELFIESQTLNFAVSGLKIAEWLDKIGLKISELPDGAKYKNVEFLAQKGLTKLGKVECF
jgi:S1-C subfamily serine protease